VPRQRGDELEQTVPLRFLVEQLVPPGVPRYLPNSVLPEDRHAGIHIIAHLPQRAPPLVQSAKHCQTGSESAAHRYHRRTVLVGGLKRRQRICHASLTGGVECGLEPPELVTVESEQLFQLGGRDRTGRATHTQHLTHSLKALRQPGILAAPLQRRHQGFDCPNDCCQVHS
jgi:hypothetical protein